MPTIITPNSMPAIATALGAQRYRLIGLHIKPAAGVYVYDLIHIGDAYTTDVNLLAREVELDRLYVHGDPSVGGKRGIALNSVATTVKNSYIVDFKSNFQDSQAIAGWNGAGPFRIVNNRLEASGENIMFGGAVPSIVNMVPSDIFIERNHFFKPLSWNPQHATYEGQFWVVKNLLEFKNSRRVLVRGNVFENCWEAGQRGYALNMTVRTEMGQVSWAVNEDLTVEYNIFRNVLNGGGMHGWDDTDGVGSGHTNRITVRNNVFEQVGSLFVVLNGIQNLTIDHNTVFNYGDKIMILDGGPGSGLVFTNNIVLNNLYGIHGSGVGMGIPAFQRFFPEYQVRRNALAGAPAYAYPLDNFFPSDFSSVGFQNQAGGDYRLSESSPYRLAGTDGTDLGADIGGVNSATAGVVEPSGVLVRVNPGAANVEFGATQQFVATVTGAVNSGVTWSLEPAVGSISASGLYTAPASLSGSQTVTVRATSVQDQTKWGSAGVTLTAAPQATAPTFSPAAGTYQSPQTVTLLTTNAGALIRYTSDGSDPTAVSGTSYAGPVNVSASTTLKAIAYKAGMTSSTVSAAVYTIQPPELSELSCASNELTAGQSMPCTVMLSNVATSPVSVSLSSTLSALSVPSSVAINTGSSSGSFTAVAGSVNTIQAAVLMAIWNGRSRVALVTVNPGAPPPSGGGQGLIGHWALDEGSGTTAADTSGNNYNGVVNGASWTAGKVNSALSFNGTSSSVVTPGISLGNAFSVSAWVNPAVATQGAYVRIAETRYDGGLYLGTNATGTRYKFIVNTAFGASGTCGAAYGCAEGGTITAGWHLVTATFDGTVGKLYVDGALVASETFTAPPATNFPLYIGRYYGGRRRLERLGGRGPPLQQGFVQRGGRRTLWTTERRPEPDRPLGVG